jgi:thymidylate synthase
MSYHDTRTFTEVWRDLLCNLLLGGEEVSPRGQLTRELRQRTIEIEMRRPVLLDPRRKLSFSGLAAEAYWICSGDSSLAGIEPWLPRMKEFSDDGVTLAGAYGPRIHEQLTYVVEKLKSDPDTRQATLTIWDRNPGPSRDYPCTVAMDFKLRGGKLNLHVFMRSSDAWLGIPYDVFSFAMVAHLVCCRLNAGHACLEACTEPGTLYLTAASSHLYERDWLGALRCLSSLGDVSQYPTPEGLWTDEQRLLTRLELLRNSHPGDRLRWWESNR